MNGTLGYLVLPPNINIDEGEICGRWRAGIPLVTRLIIKLFEIIYRSMRREASRWDDEVSAVELHACGIPQLKSHS